MTRLILATVFAVAGVAKLADRAGTRKAVVEFGASERLAPALALLIPAAELAVAVLLLLPTPASLAGTVGALALLLLFSAVVAVSLARGRAPECHCFGQLHSAPASWKTLARNALLALLALAPFAGTLGVPELDALGWLRRLEGVELVAFGAAAAALALLAGGAAALLSLLRSYGRLLVRLERVEAALASEGIELAEADEAEFGLEPGTAAPAFKAASPAGGVVSLAELLAPGRPLLLFFTSPRCGPCKELLPTAREWQRRHGEVFTFAFASEGEAEEVRAETGELLHVLVDRGGRIYRAFEARGTPGAVLIHPDGTIGSWVASGREAIERLVKRVLGSREAVAAPSLPLGSDVPPLELPALDGAPVSLASFRGQEVLLLFWNSNCGFCRSMRSELRALETSTGQRRPRLVIVSTGDANSVRSEGFRATILLDEGLAAGALFGARGTPMAVLLGAEGRVASEVVAGAPAVLALATREVEPASP